MLHERHTRIGELLEQLRPHIRPEGDAIAGALSVAIEQAMAAAEDLGVPPAPTPVDVEMRALRAELGQLLHLPMQVQQVHENVSAMRESAGL